MTEYMPEGELINTAANRNALSGISSVKEAMIKETVLEARALLCDREHNLHIDLGCMNGIIPREEGAIGISEGNVRDIALISRVGRPICFVVTDIKRDENGKLYAVLSRKKAQLKCEENYLSGLIPGDIIDAKINHIDSFGVFCDIGCGISALLSIDGISVSRIPHPGVRFFNGQHIKTIVKSRDLQGRIMLTHKELLGTWQENASRFNVGETVPGIIRTVENYGVFVELAPNLAGLAEYDPDVNEGDYAAVYIKSIIPERMKIKLVIVDSTDEKPQNERNIEYFYEGNHMDSFLYSPPESKRIIETVFDRTY